MMREFEIERQFNIKIETIKANKGVYYLKTNKGERCLKRINYGPQKLLFVYGAKEHLIKNGFKNVDEYFIINKRTFSTRSFVLFIFIIILIVMNKNILLLLLLL